MGEKTFDDTQMMQQQMSMGTGMGMDAPNLFKGEKDALEMTVHTWKVDSFIEKAAQAVAI